MTAMTPDDPFDRCPRCGAVVQNGVCLSVTHHETAMTPERLREAAKSSWAKDVYEAAIAAADAWEALEQTYARVVENSSNRIVALEVRIEELEAKLRWGPNLEGLI